MKIISDRPDDPNFFQHVTGNTHIFFGLTGFFMHAFMSAVTWQKYKWKLETW